MIQDPSKTEFLGINFTLKDGSTVFVENKQYRMKENINELVNLCYKSSFDAGWHTDLATGQLKDRNRAEMLMLMVSELAECMEGERKGLMDTHLPHRPMPEV